MSTRRLTKFLGLILVVGLLLAVLPMQAKAQGGIQAVLDVCAQDCTYSSIQDAINAAQSGDTISVSGVFPLNDVVILDKAVTLTCAQGAKIQVSGTGDRFDVRAAATISNCEIEKTDKTGEQNIIRLNNANASGAKIIGNKIHGQWAIGDGEVTRAMVINAGSLTGIEISNNEIYGIRQPAYISGDHEGMVTNNYVHGTKGWVLEGGHLTFEGNTFSGNVGDIAILSTMPSMYYTDILAISAANNDAVVEDQRVSPAVLSVAYVDASAAAGGNGTQASPYQTIQAGIDRVIAGGKVFVAPGNYIGGLNLNKPIKLVGLQNTRTFDSVAIGERAPGVWYPDRFAPAYFKSTRFEGKTVLRHGVLGSQKQSNSFYNYQGRKLDVNLSGPTITVSIDLFVGSDWGSKQRNAGFWATGLDSENVVSAYPMIAWRSGGPDPAGFYAFDYFYGGWLKLREATDEDYGKWHNLAFTYNVGEGVSYFLDGEFQWSFADSYTTQIANIILNVYNFGEDYDVYWDNLTDYTNEAKVTGLMNITANNVIVDGFTLENPNQAQIVSISETTSGVSLFNNLIQNVGGSTLGQVHAVYLVHGPDNVTIERNTFKNIVSGTSSAKGILSGDSNTTDAAAGLIIRANTFTNISASRGAYGVLLNNGTGNPGAIIEANAFNGLNGSWTHAIGLEGPTQNAQVKYNAFSGLTASSQDNSAIFFEDNSAGGSVAVQYNKFFHTGFGVGIHPDDQPGGTNHFDYTVNASPNWWGNISGPVVSSQIFGPVSYDPWCGDAECSFLNPNYLPDDVEADGIQSAINAAPEGAIIVIPAGTYNMNGGFTISNPGITIRLANGAVIQNDSPCFIVNANNVTITAETFGGAKCVPTGGADGIVVNDGKNGVRILGLEIDGSDPTSSRDGIHFNGTTTDFQIVNNFIHNMGGNAVEFVGTPGGTTMDIQGNLFKSNTGAAIAVPAGANLDATYNSWGAMVAPIISDVITDPNTHVKVFVESSGTPWANQVVAGATSTITYTVKAELKNITGAELVLLYPEGITAGAPVISGGNPFDTKDVSLDSTNRKISFYGWKTPGTGGTPAVPVSEGTYDLFTVTFTVPTAGSYTLSFDLATDNFAMAPASGPSNYVYADSLTGATIKAITLPTISSTNIQGYYLTGEERQFSVVLTNPPSGGDFAHVYVDYTIAGAKKAEIDLIEYSVDNGDHWVALGGGPGTSYEEGPSGVYGYFGKLNGLGFPIEPGGSLTTLFKVKFANRASGEPDYPTSYEFSMSLKDADTDPDVELDSFTGTAKVYDPPTMASSDIQGYYLTGEERAFHVQVNNPTTGGSFTSIYYNFEIANAALADIASLTCDNHTVSLSQSGANLTGSTGPFPMPANQSWNTECKVKFNTAKDYVFTVSMTDTTPETDRTLVAYTNTANVYTPPTLTSTDIQGPYEAGVAKDFHTTVDNPLNRGKSYVNSIYYVFTIEGAVKANFISLQCYFDTTPTDILALMDEEGGNLVGRVGYDSAGFPMPAPFNGTTRCTLNAATAGTYTFTVDMVDNPSGDPANDRILTSLSAQATVTGSLDIAGTFSMQGRVTRGGIPVTFTLSAPPFTKSAQTADMLGVNLNVSVTYTGSYAVTTNQPRYLNLSTEINKHITVDGDMVLSPLVLRGGNVTDQGESLNKVDVSDAGVVGGDYRKTGDNPGDANFDLIVNIQDLALVGSNFLLDSATAYAGWMNPAP